MKKKLTIFLILLTIGTACYFGYVNIVRAEYIEKVSNYDAKLDVWNKIIAESINSKDIELYVDGRDIDIKNKQAFMDDRLTLMIPLDVVTEAFDCSVNVYDNSTIVIQKANVKYQLKKDEYNVTSSSELTNNDIVLLSPVRTNNNKFFIPAEFFIRCYSYNYNWDIEKNKAIMVNNNPEKSVLPYSYSYTSLQKLPSTKNQWGFGTCWAFASLTAIETSLLPEENYILSEDHMTLNNSFLSSQYIGGDYTMAMAYLTSWQGPVLESQDPYGDGKTVDDAKVVKHIQEIQILESKNYESIKEMIFKYGGVQSSLYTMMTSKNDSSYYYNEKNYSYCYIGTEKPNHDIVIVGWDDTYKKENFNLDVDGNGAFICLNSWGNDFGNNGLFYVSYYDTNIGKHNIAYTGIENTDNYDNNYQTDLCGWQGYMGYEKEFAYFANVFAAKAEENIKAVGFYATGKNTTYNIYMVHDFVDENTLINDTKLLTTGTFENAGFYTVELPEEQYVKTNERYAIIIKINTIGSEMPIAVEYAKDEQTANVDLSDGHGYVSWNGTEWQNTEKKYDCNVCMKVYTNNR